MRFHVKPRLWFMYILIIIVAVVWSIFETKPDLSEVSRLSQNKQYGEALQAVNHILEEYPDDLDALNEQGYLLLRLGRNEEALLALTKVVEEDPAHAAALNHLAWAYHNLSLQRIANAYIDRALLIGQNTDIQYVNKANIELALNNYANALKYYDLALKLNAGSENAAFGKGLAYYRQANYQQAVVWLSKHLALVPDDQDGWNYLVSAYLKSNDYAGAIGEYQKRIEQEPGNVQLLVSLGGVYTTMREYGKAIELFDQAIGQNPEFAQAYYEKGLSMIMTGDYDAACDQLVLAVRYNKDYLYSFKDEPKLDKIKQLPKFKQLFM
ncbi:tetratricopeptide repeat protein|uniref:Tetratricopeptide repeat-containing protein n=1 Tax=Dendrosporobacter quercicolus TaxID=146817 RepID=A0A1G9RW89_9FIRM|nr:tetratricopeptide repeat protein [Dendrosporobacter quercicolus]NSL49320.1 tetratricopeptide repeat protein [Dendrosporobacter quercicolus DSM 1736]SDM27558.1 Tetratricopeptide repeat-containing protein [Dendrosporobacter quercicolus]